MFDSIKKAVLAKRIKKCVLPVANIVNEGAVIYQRTLQNLISMTMDVVKETIPIIEKHSDRIAEAVILLEPVFKELKSVKSIKKFVDNDFEVADEVTDVSVKNIEEYIAELKAYSQEV